MEKPVSPYDTRLNPTTAKNRFQTFPQKTGLKPVLHCILFGISLALRLVFLFETPFAHGADGYYYAAQIKYLLTRGFFFSPDASPLLYLMAGMARLTGTSSSATSSWSPCLGRRWFSGYLLGRERDRSLQRASSRGRFWSPAVSGPTSPLTMSRTWRESWSSVFSGAAQGDAGGGAVPAGGWRRPRSCLP